MSYLTIHFCLIIVVILFCLKAKVSKLLKAFLVFISSLFILFTNNYLYTPNGTVLKFNSDFETLKEENKDLFVDFYYFDSYIWPIANKEKANSSVRLDALEDYFFFILEDRYPMEYAYQMFIQVGYTLESKTLYNGFEINGETKEVYTPSQNVKVTIGSGFYDYEKIYLFKIDEKYITVDLMLEEDLEDVEIAVLEWIDDVYQLNKGS